MRAFAVILLLLPLAPVGQVVVGARAGLNISTLTPDLFAEQEIRVAPAAALLVEAPIRGALGARAEALYSSEGVGLGPSRAFRGQGDGDIRADYVGGGLYATYRVPLGGSGFALAPYVGVAAALKVRETSSTREAVSGDLRTDSSDLLAPAYASAVGGLGVQRGAFGVGLRYALGLEDGFNREMIVRITGTPVVRPSVVTFSGTYQIGQ